MSKENWANSTTRKKNVQPDRYFNDRKGKQREAQKALFTVTTQLQRGTNRSPMRI